MAFKRVGSADDLRENEMVSFFVDYEEVLVLRDEHGTLHAFEATCPHEDFPLVEGDFDGATITCANHGWIINATTGRGINPPNCRIAEYPIRIEGPDVLVDLDAEVAPPGGPGPAA